MNDRLLKIERPIRNMLRKRGVEITRYGLSVTARRQMMLEHYGIKTLVDVGANVGQYAQMSRRAGYSGRILSFEPLGSAFERLSKAAATDPKWDTVRCAVGAEQGTVALNVSENSIFSSILPALDNAETASGGGARAVAVEDVPVDTLDTLMPVAPGATMVKIDVQGFERAVLDGGSKAIENASIVEMELSPQPVYDGGMLMDEAVGRLSAAGLTLALTENLLMDAVTGRSLQFDGIFVRL